MKGIPYDTPVLGYRNNTANTLRLWRAEAPESFDLSVFNRGDYYGAVQQKIVSENISKVLYPNDEQIQGKELRLEQQYFFVSCSLQDMLRIMRGQKIPLERFHEKFAVQLNDTHPAIAIAELMRLLVDEHGMEWNNAWSITTQCFGYTNHTLLPEALERWPLALISRVLPRHVEIVLEINAHFLDEVRCSTRPRRTHASRACPSSTSPANATLRMAHLASVGSHAINGVAALHSELLKQDVLRGFPRLVAGQIPQRHQRGDAQALDRAGQPAPHALPLRCHRRRLGAGPGAAAPDRDAWPRIPVSAANGALSSARSRRIWPPTCGA